jgi:hypothetical protein
VLKTFNKTSLISNLIGTSYDNDHELRAHPSGLPDNEMDETGYFERLGAKTETFLEKFFTAWGTFCAENPWKVISLSESANHESFLMISNSK